jgi:hypothetical protein
VRPAKLDWVRNEIIRLLQQIRAQECEIRMLQRAVVPTASAELLLTRMRAKLDDLCRERETLGKADRCCVRPTGRSPRFQKRSDRT